MTPTLSEQTFSLYLISALIYAPSKYLFFLKIQYFLISPNWKSLSGVSLPSGQTPYQGLHACRLSCFGCVQLFAMLWTVVDQALLSMGFSRQKNTGIGCHVRLFLQGIFLTQGLPGLQKSWPWMPSLVSGWVTTYPLFPTPHIRHSGILTVCLSLPGLGSCYFLWLPLSNSFSSFMSQFSHHFLTSLSWSFVSSPSSEFPGSPCPSSTGLQTLSLSHVPVSAHRACPAWQDVEVVPSNGNLMRATCITAFSNRHILKSNIEIDEINFERFFS